MNIWKRAYLHTVRKKGKTMLMFFILLIVSTMILTCLSIRSATNTAALNIRKSLMGGFTINATHIDNFLDKNIVDTILKIPGVKDYNLRSYYLAEYRDISGNKLLINTDDSVPPSKGQEHSGKLIASSQSNQDNYFKESGFKLIEGRHLNKKDQNAILVSEDFAKRNSLTIGDVIILGDNYLNKEARITIIGIFNPTQAMENRASSSPDSLYENIGFIDHTTYSKLNFDDANIHYQYGDFYVSDPAKLDSIISKVKDIKGISWENCIFTKNDAAYQNAKTQLQALQNLVTVMVFVLISISIIILAFILLLWTRNRIQEIGMMLAIGIEKKSIFMQHVLEVVLIAILAFGISYCTSSLMSQTVGDILIEQNNAKNHIVTNNLTEGTSKNIEKDDSNALDLININVSIENLAFIYVIGIGIIIISLALASYPIMRLKPKQVLVKLS